jgi:hypothetical protein
MKVGSPIAKNHSFKPHASLVIMVFIGLRDAYYIKLVSGATAAIRPTHLFTSPEMMQDNRQLPCNCCDDSLLAKCRSTSCKPQPSAPQVVVPKLSGQMDPDMMWNLLFHYG